ncbi:MAG: ECF transporter S component [Muribaculaceae bacterium]|nr:ECF transporter S component [Muribaculaceae bacterium]
MEHQLKLYSTGYANYRTYLLAVIFVCGNVLLPQLCHQVELGGPTWLPIYFFTLIGAYKYGPKVGLLTAVASPIINSLFFGMPLLSAVFVITVKSVLLAIAAGYAAERFKKASLLILATVVMTYKLVGTAIEWLVVRDFYTAIQDFRIGLPGMMVQVMLGWYMINVVMRK